MAQAASAALKPASNDASASFLGLWDDYKLVTSVWDVYHKSTKARIGRGSYGQVVLGGGVGVVVVVGVGVGIVVVVVGVVGVLGVVVVVVWVVVVGVEVVEVEVLVVVVGR